MKIVYKKTKKISPKQLLDLYKSVKWAEEGEKGGGKFILKIYKNSDMMISAWKDKELVGIIRALTDKTVNGFILGLVIKKEYQRKGIGKRLIKECIETYPKMGWYLGAKKENIHFYKKVGFKLDGDPWFKKV